MDKTTEILLIVCFILIGALGIIIGFLIPNLLHEPVNPNMTNNNTVQAQHPHSTVQNSSLNNTKVLNNTKKGEKTFQGQSYIIINNPLDFVGECIPVCPFCGSTDTEQLGSSTEGKKYWYYYHCNFCDKYFASDS